MSIGSNFTVVTIAVRCLLTANCVFCLGDAVTANDEAAVSSGARSSSGIVALYDFRSPDGPVIQDRAETGDPLDLRILEMKAVRRSEGALEVLVATTIRSEKPATKIGTAIRRSGEITIEAWLQPAKTNLNGPARIVTLSKNTSERNFTLGQENDQFDARLRTSKTGANGIPSITSSPKSLSRQLTHVVYTRGRNGLARIYINGKQNTVRKVAGELANWNGSFQLALANELTGDRPWLGTYRLIAIYDRSLPPAEVEQNFRAGADTSASPEMLARRQQLAADHQFETVIAPLLARRCLECHDASTKKGALDLSRRDAALAGGESGAALVPGQAAKSLLWELVEANEMPHERPPLSAAEKSALRNWIDAGAAWSFSPIDPAVYMHEARDQQIWVQRLTVAEYIQTVRSTVGVDITQEARELLPPDLRTDGFSNTAYNLNVDLKHIDAYARLAETIVERMDNREFAARFTKSRKLTDDDMRALIAKMGKWLLRGPLSEPEVDIYRGISTTIASAGGTFDDAVGYIVAAMLQSPRFLYRMEDQRGTGKSRLVGDYELASRLSYIIWGGPPDEELLRAAGAGELGDPNRARKQVERMVRDPRAVERSLQFVEQWLNLGRLESLHPNRAKFPAWDDRLTADMREETKEFFREIAWRQQRPLADLFNAQLTFATPRLAQHYGLPSPGNSESESGTFVRYDLSSVPGRGGLLTQGSVLTVGGDEASMVTRGLFVLQDVLRGVVKDPPPGVNTTPVPTKAGLSQRVIAEQRIANVACGGCHDKFEPLAFGLERFDGIGRYLEKDEHGNALRQDGAMLVPGSEHAVKYETSGELMDLLAASERVGETITWKTAQFALGRPLTAVDAPILQQIQQASRKNGGTYASLITAIVMSDLVRMTQTERIE